jgi:hypothetical protein
MMRKMNQKIAFALALVMLYQALYPIKSYALTGGPTQPEVQGFTPIGANNMVDLFTGDFSYNIPLMDVDGYPINLSYQSNPTMDQEASWVGLGWSLNPGVLNRDLRGFPDDFRGDQVLREKNIKPNQTIGVTVSPRAEVFGFFKSGIKTGVFFNSYRGWGTEVGLSNTLSAGNVGKGYNLGASFNVNLNSQSGIDLDFGLQGRDPEIFLGASTGLNSRTGLKALTFEGGEHQMAKVKKTVVGSSFGGSISFAQRTYFPAADFPMLNRSIALNFTPGVEANGLFAGGNFSGYASTQFLAFKKQNNRAFGYLYMQDGKANGVESRALMDYNREKVMPYRKDVPNIPIPYGTYDVFSASGQGVQGQFKASRNDIGILSQQTRNSNSAGISAGFDAGGGGVAKSGANINLVNVSSTSKEWRSGNKARLRMPFTQADRTYESVFFKNMGENVPTDPTFYNNTGADMASKVGLTSAGVDFIADQRWDNERLKQAQSTTPMSADLKRNNREKRNQVFSYLNAREAAVVGLNKMITSCQENTLVFPCPAVPAHVTTITRTGGQYQNHHLSEVTVTQGDGSRYVYGTPVYNTKNREVTFNVNGANAVSSSGNVNYGLVSYNSAGANPDNSINNTLGRDNYFEAQDIPAYAHAFLLSGVLSPDYVDRTGDGITDDDPGNAVKLNYTKASNNYKWRIPAQTNMARYQAGRRADPLDDKGHYVYGEKELWYVHSIESRTMVAQFYTSNRDDAHGVLNEDGGINTSQSSKSRKLDSIRLFSKSDLRLRGSAAVPIKTVRLFYDYSLCSNLPNSSNSGGKLTLKTVDFIYQNSTKGSKNPYKFSYSTTNPTYNMGLYDRWGNYQNNPAPFPLNMDYPYTMQTAAQLSPSAWNLTSITLPSGAKIDVEYEADDYAFVQDRRAGKMALVRGYARWTGSALTATSNALYDASNPTLINDHILVGSDGVNVTNMTDAQMRKIFLDGLDKIYFQADVELKPSGGSLREYITGYMQVDNTKPIRIISSSEIAIPVKAVQGKNRLLHPITLAGFQTMRLELPEVTWGNSAPFQLPANPAKSDFIKAARRVLAGSRISDINTLIRGFDVEATRRGFCRTTGTESDATGRRSWIRLMDADYKKFGGGSRVKKVTVSDLWNYTPNGGAASVYGQEYTYTTTEPGISGTISSGVAAYEPAIGNEENTLREPLPYRKKVLLAPNNLYYSETPLGESLYPGPVVGYREVRVQNLTYPGVTRTATGYSINKFYTAKEFPVLADFTNNRPANFSSGSLSRFFKLYARDLVTVSQGFVVEVNDMHGKMREEANYNQAGALIRSVRYEYKVDDPNAAKLHLNNNVPVVRPDGSIVNTMMGVDVDVWQEMQQDETFTRGVGVQANFDITVTFPVPNVLPSPQIEYTRLRTAATTKYLKRFGILDKVVVNDNGSVASTRNVVFDAETGSPLVTETQNEFNDNVYNFSYPAHWVYSGIGLAYRNIGAVANNVQIIDGQMTGITNPADIFVDGDELILQKTNSATPETQRFFIYYSQGVPLVIAESGLTATFPSNQVNMRVIRSGRRNMLDASVGQVKSLVNPASGANLSLGSQSKVLDANAAEYQEIWSMFCNRYPSSAVVGTYVNTTGVNPYLLGRNGNWRINKTHAFYNDRDQNVAAPVVLRNQGTVNNFVPFWTYDGTKWNANATSGNGWTLSNTITRYDIRGNVLEAQSPINIYSSKQYGYNNTRLTALADNAGYQDMAYEGFEDLNFNVPGNCANSTDQGMIRKLYFGYTASGYVPINVTSTNAHTGKYSLQIAASSNVSALIPNSANAIYCDLPPSSPPQNANVAEAFDAKALAPSFPLAFLCSNCLPGTVIGSNTSNPNGEYLVSLWVATSTTIAQGGAPSSINLSLEIRNGLTQQVLQTINMNPSGPVVDGWQRIEGKVTLANSNALLIRLNNQSSTNAMFVDDFRIHPWKSNMKSYVYDTNTLRLLAELDENNYAMIYEYDDEGQLLRVKKETEKGVMTVKEVRSNIKPN